MNDLPRLLDSVARARDLQPLTDAVKDCVMIELENRMDELLAAYEIGPLALHDFILSVVIGEIEGMDDEIQTPAR